MQMKRCFCSAVPGTMLHEQLDELLGPQALQRGPEAEDDNKSQSLLVESSQTMQAAATMMTTTLISLLNQ